VDEVVGVEEQVQVLGRFRQEERLHPVLESVVADVLRKERGNVRSHVVTSKIFDNKSSH
jgi:hypothetical protein